jgi:nucleoside diphosphate kinase
MALSNNMNALDGSIKNDYAQDDEDNYSGDSMSLDSAKREENKEK